MNTFVAVAVFVVVPTPYDLTHAGVLLGEPPGWPCPAPTPGLRRAAVAVMLARGAIDPGGEGIWFAPHYPFDSELDHARRVLAEAGRCPPADAGDWLPPADVCDALAAVNRAVAADYRERCGWEADRADWLTADAEACERLAGAWALLGQAGRPQGWCRPRRVVLGEIRAAMGVGWGRRDLPPAVVSRCFRER